MKVLYTDADAYVETGKLKFKNGKFFGITARLWDDEIFILFDDNFAKNHPNISDNINYIYKNLNEVFDYSMENKTVLIKPISKISFQDTKRGMKQRASYYVLILDLCLQSLIKEKSI